MQLSPTVKLNLQTPLLHPRLEIHSTQTWVLKEGGDSNGNYYGGAYFGSNSPAEQRIQQVKAKYRESIPQSNPMIDHLQNSSTSNRSLGSRISTWLENDGWMPQKISTNLFGNLVSVNDIGFGTSKVQQLGISHLRSNIGLRIRISKKIDWTKLGIFPWSNNSFGRLREGKNNNQATTLRVELCGLNASEDRRGWVAFETDPMDSINRFKVIVGQESLHT
jgi:hypothetical protein